MNRLTLVWPEQPREDFGGQRARLLDRTLRLHYSHMHLPLSSKADANHKASA